MKRLVSAILVLMAVSGAIAAEKTVYKQGEKNWIDTNHYFTYDFNSRPKIGYVIVKMKMFDKDGISQSGYSILAVYSMPSMPSMGSASETPFKINKKGDYLLPVYVSMLGTWQVNIKISKDKKLISSGAISFDVK